MNLRVSLLARGVIVLAALCHVPAGRAAAQDAQHGQDAQPLHDVAAARVDAIFADFDRSDGPGAAVAVIRDGVIVLERGYGMAQLEHDVPVTPATVFHVASVSKQFAAFAILLLAEQGRLSVDDDIRTHLPELHDFGHRITIRHLIHHTSGIRDQWELLMMAGWRIDDVITRDQILAMMRRQRELNFEPGSEYLYSNMGYSLLAEIVERVSGMSYGEFLHAHVFEPLGMRGTHVHSDHEMVVRGRAYSYRMRGGDSVWRNAVLNYANQGATSLFTTAGDLARWLHNFEAGAVGGARLSAQMRQRGVLNSGDTIPYAFAIIRGEHRGRTTWSHGGSDAGFRSTVLHFPAERLGIVVLSNAANAVPARLAAAVADAYLGEAVAAEQETAAGPRPTSFTPPEPAWQPTTAQLRALAGDYYSPELGTVYTIELRGDRLVAVHHRTGEMNMAPQAEHSFRMGNRTARFELDDAGAVTGFRLTGSRVRNLAFVRLAAGVLPGG